MMKPPKIEVQRMPLTTLIDGVGQGLIRIPRFQREFVWGRGDIRGLLDSMRKEYPIGTIFLWDAPPEYNSLLRDIPALNQPPAKLEHRHKIILDGQQRVTSLYAVIQALQIDGEDYGKFVIDLDADRLAPDDTTYFLFRQPDNQRWVSIRDLLSSNPFKLFRSLTEARQEVFDEVRQTLMTYPFSVVTVSVDNIRDAVMIFERINRRGRRLTRYDLICASLWSHDFDLRERAEKDILNQLKPSFGKVPESLVPQALALLAQDSAADRAQLNLQTDEVQRVWDDTIEGFKSAVDFLRTNLGVARSDFLPYDSTLPVLIKYFHEAGTKNIESAEHLRQLSYWFWRSAFSLRFGRSAETRITEDAQWVKQLVAIAEEHRRLQLAEFDLAKTNMRSASAIARGILCLLALRQPLHFTSKARINLDTPHFSSFTRAERHHIFPAGYLVDQRKKKYVHALPNFCFIPADLNKKISDRAPSDYMKEILKGYDSHDEFERVMATHLIPVGDDSGIWTDDYELFLDQRASLLMDEIRRRCGIGSRIHAQERDLVVNQLENALRDTIHETLLKQTAEYWALHIPSHTSDNLQRKIDQEARKSPGNSAERFDSPRAKLDYCDVTDYADIILSKTNWLLFQETFSSKGTCDRMFGDLREYRNALKHNRDMSEIVALQGQAAIVWLCHALDLDLSEFGIKSPE